MTTMVIKSNAKMNSFGEGVSAKATDSILRIAKGIVSETLPIDFRMLQSLKKTIHRVGCYKMWEDEVLNSEDDHDFCGQHAKLPVKKIDDVCINSGATYHFFHSRCTFTTYERIQSRKVKAASSIPRLAGKGKARLMIANEIVVNLYQAAHISSNIFYDGQLIEQFIITSTNTLRE